jgi:hypothetical protein
MKKATLLVGCPASGKSWVAEQVKDKYHYVPHDDHIGGDYIKAAVDAVQSATKPVLLETPFSMSKIMEPLNMQGILVTPVHIQDDHEKIAERYRSREGKEIPNGHLTRQKTYLQRAMDSGDFHGTPDEVLNYLKTKGE